jgi:hypothetical protein
MSLTCIRVKRSRSRSTTSRSAGPEGHAMAADPAEIQSLASAYASCTGQPCSTFFCPILLKEENVELCDGHILPQGFRAAGRATVVQRKDVDNFYGTALEPDLIQFLNSDEYTQAEFLSRARNVTVSPPGKATPAATFVPSPKSSPKQPRIALLNEAGQVIASYCVRAPAEAFAPGSGQVRVEGELRFSRSAIHGALIRSAHLALFRVFAYRWPLTAAGRHIAGILADFFRDLRGKSCADEYFTPFYGAVNFFWGQGLPQDTLSVAQVLIHLKPGGTSLPDAFAVSCLFNINQRTWMVTVPYGTDEPAFPDNLSLYRQFLADRYMEHPILLTRFYPDGRAECQPIRMQYTEPSDNDQCESVDEQQ